MRRIILLLIFVLSVTSLHAHIGSPDIIYEGNAGPYKFYTIIQAPDVVPGTAKVFISFPDGKNRKVNIQPVYYKYGDKGAPPADQTIPIDGVAGQYQGQLWLMSFGSSSVKITVEGEKGFGATLIPVPAVATATRKMETGTGIVLGILGLLLFFSMLTIIGASIGEATLQPGKVLNVAQKRKVQVLMVIVGIFLAAGIYFANKWWGVVEGQYRKNMFKPLVLNSTINEEDGRSILKIDLTNKEWLNRKISDLVPDHGKVMHLFMVDKSNNIFAHLHPAQKDTNLFYSSLPSLPSGEYLLFADIVHKDGMTETLTDTLEIASPIKTTPLADPDDSWAKVIPSGNQMGLEEDLIMVADFPKEFKARSMTDLKIKIHNQRGDLVDIQPYMGMSGHAVVMKDDGSVFIHIHPMGTISMMAQYALSSRIKDKVSFCGVMDSSAARIYDTLGVMGNPEVSLMKNKVNMNASIKGDINFPYAFPSAGKYKVWIQFKKSNKIQTGVFDVVVN